MKEIEILNFKDFENFKKSYLKEKRNGTLDGELPIDEILASCLRLMYILNVHRKKINEEEIHDVARFLDRNFDTDFDFQFGIFPFCPYNRKYCDITCCGPSEYENCSADTPTEYLHQDSETVNMKIKEEALKRNINLENAIFQFILKKAADLTYYQYSEEVQKKNQELFLEIWNGKNILISIDYKNHDPFIDMLQGMLHKGYKNINYYMLYERGLIDDNTFQTVLRINQNLRSNEPSMKQTIDRIFMEDLVKNFVNSNLYIII